MKTNTDKHTPGPWVISDNALDPENTILDGARGARIGRFQICYNVSGYSDEQSAANTRLIAAAPALLAALENIIETAPIDIECEDSVEKYRSFVLRVACAAVAAVQGGAK